MMEKAYDLIRKEKLVHWISDQTHMKVISPENQKWVNEYFIPKVLGTTKIKKVAILVSQDIFTSSSMVSIRAQLEKSKMPIQYFNSLAVIQEWFRQP